MQSIARSLAKPFEEQLSSQSIERAELRRPELK